MGELNDALSAILGLGVEAKDLTILQVSARVIVVFAALLLVGEERRNQRC
jgi:hypothetical protein